MTTYLHPQVENSTVHLKIQNVRKEDLNLQVLEEIQKTNEGSCGNHGYVIKGDTQLTNRSAGRIVTVDSESHLEFNVTYKFTAIYPCKGDEYECKIDSITKMGVLGFLDYQVSEDEVTTSKNSPVLFILPNEFMKDVPETQQQIGKTLTVQVLDSRIKYRSHQIQVVAKPSV